MKALFISKMLIIMACFVISPVHAKESQYTSSKTALTKEQQVKLNESCTARDGWRDARNSASPERCKGSDNYLQYMREWTTGITSRWYFN